MGILFVDRKDSELSVSGKSLTLRAGENHPRHIPAALLKTVVLHPSTRLKAGALAALTALDVGVVVIGGQRGQRIAQLIGTPHKDVSRRITQILRLDDPQFQLDWCRDLVDRKIRAHLKLLQQIMEQRPDKRKPLFSAVKSMEKCRQNLPESSTVEQIRGQEGAAAAAYFPGLSSAFPPSLDFTSRNRRPPADPVNACLSLGYTLLYSQAIQVCYSQGLDPMVGYLHRPQHGRASMASDLIEPWRARIDQLVWQLFRTRQLDDSHFGSDGKNACLLNKKGRSRFYAAWAVQLKPLRRAMRRQASVIGQVLDTSSTESTELLP